MSPSPDWAEVFEAARQKVQDAKLATEDEEDEITVPDAPLPTLDDTDRAIANRTIIYPDWKKEDTFICSGPIEGQGAGPGTPQESVLAAAVHVLRIHGHIIERIKSAEKGGRWAFRVFLPGKGNKV